MGTLSLLIKSMVRIWSRLTSERDNSPFTGCRIKDVKADCMCGLAESEGWTHRKRQREDRACTLSGSHSTDMQRGACVFRQQACVLEEQISDVKYMKCCSQMGTFLQ